jgi:GntR family transcriptional regulator/MocR family aminotransferase
MTSLMRKELTSTTVELFVPLSRGKGNTLGRQIEAHLRDGIRSGALKPRAILPSTRDLAGQLKISRPIVVDAYAQLASEGFILLKQGARPRVADHLEITAKVDRACSSIEIPPRYDFRPAIPDLQSFPRKAWLRATRKALDRMKAKELGYDSRHGTETLRHALAEYLGRVRGVVADPSAIVVTSGYAQSRSLFCRALEMIGGKYLAVENPSYTQWEFAKAANLDLVPIDVDENGVDVQLLMKSEADAIIVTPTHQSPTGHALSGERRTALLSWLRSRRTFALEDDYDAEFRYDRPPIGALQGLAPERIVYSGTVSKTLAPGVRIGWLVVPKELREAVLFQHRVADHGAPRIDQNALAVLIADGEFDRHLRRVRLVYRKRRDALMSALAKYIPEASVSGIAAGLHAAVALPRGVPEQALAAEAARRGVRFEFMSEYCLGPPQQQIPQC